MEAGLEALRRALASEPARTARWRRGYAAGEVDALLRHLRAEAATGAAHVTSRQVRAAGFRLVLGGYDVAGTDAVLAQVEDALAAAERTRALRSGDRRTWVEQATAIARAVQGRLARADGARFPRGRLLERGYHPADVDALCHLLAEHFAGRALVRPADVRSALFRPRHGRWGYREVPVDAFFDRVVELLTAVGRPAAERPDGADGAGTAGAAHAERRRGERRLEERRTGDRRREAGRS